MRCGTVFAVCNFDIKVNFELIYFHWSMIINIIKIIGNCINALEISWTDFKSLEKPRKVVKILLILIIIIQEDPQPQNRMSTIFIYCRNNMLDNPCEFLFGPRKTNFVWIYLIILIYFAQWSYLLKIQLLIDVCLTYMRVINGFIYATCYTIGNIIY